MNVLFDISDLSNSHYKRGALRGISRVVSSILESLRTRCDLSISATENSYNASVFLGQSDLNLKLASTEGNPIHRVSGLAVHWATRASDSFPSHRNLAIRSIRRASSVAGSKICDWSRELRAFDLSGQQIFHQPAPIPIPRYIREVKRGDFARFMTIYDFIPFTQGDGDLSYLKKVFASLSPEDFGMCISEFVKGEACHYLGFDPDRLFVAPLAASKEIFHPCDDSALRVLMRKQLGLGENPYFLTLSALNPRKNIPFLLKAFSQLIYSQPELDVNLVLAGASNPQTTASLQRAARELNIASRVIFTGFVPEKFLSPLYSGAEAFVFPSLSEGFGLPVLEAMQCGTAVICSNSTSLPEVLGDAGILADPTSVEGFSAAMHRVTTGTNAENEALQRAGLEQSKQFSWEICGAKHIEAYRKVLG